MALGEVKGNDRGPDDPKGNDRGSDDPKGNDRGPDDKGHDRGVVEVMQKSLSVASNLGGFFVVAFVAPLRDISNGNGTVSATSEQKAAQLAQFAKAADKAKPARRPVHRP